MKISENYFTKEYDTQKEEYKMKWDKKCVLKRRFIHLVETSKIQIEEILKEIENLADTTENKEVYEYLTSEDYGGNYLYNIHYVTDNPDGLGEEDRQLILRVYDEYICGDELQFIISLYDTIQAYYRIHAENPKIMDAINDILIDMEYNLLSVPRDIDNFLELIQ